MTAPLLDGGRREAEVDRQKAALSESLHNYAQTVLTGVQEVEDALTNETQQRKTVAGLLRQLELSNRTVVQLWDRYTNGTSGFLRVLDELRTQQRLQREVLAARAQLVRDRVDLYRTLGGTWKLNRPQGSPAESLVNETDSGSEPSEESDSAQEYEHGGAHS
jgi:outer membrane protein TolC